MKALLTLLIGLTVGSAVHAQAPKDDDPRSKTIIDNLIAKNKTWKSFDATFSSRLVNKASKLDVKQDGNIKVKGRKFRLELADNTVINDGTILWTYNKKSNEVSLSDPKEMDEQMDPANLLNIYTQGFKSQFVSEGTDAAGVAVQVIKLYPLEPAKKNYHTVVLTVDKNKVEPRVVEMHFKDGNVVTYTLNKFVPNAEMVEALFGFDKAKYPGVEVNDLR